MNKFKLTYFSLLMLCAISLFSCSKSDGEGDNPSPSEPGGGGSDQEETVDITKDLCDGSRFVKREYKDFSTSVLGAYSALTAQREYLFSKDGNGTLTTYIADKTPRGFTASTKTFAWSATDKKPVSLRVSVSGGETFTLEDIKIENNQLTSKSESLSKEQTIDGVISKDDVVSYKVNTIAIKSQDDHGRIVLLRAPSSITVQTKKGTVTFITHEYGTLAVQVGAPCYSKDGGPLTYYDSTVYAVVDTSMPYKYSFYQIDVSSDQKPFTEKNKMYFYLGSFSKDTKAFTLIENGKDYTVSN